MANPNKAVAAARRRMGGFPPRPPRPVEPFMEWLCAQARAGAAYTTLEEAEDAYDKHVKGEDQ